MNDQIWDWASPVDRSQLQVLYTRLDAAVQTPAKTKTERAARSALIGKTYENLLAVLFDSKGAISVDRNVRTATNEIDLLLKVNPTAAVLPVFKNLTHMIAEAKCHKKPPSTELINEFVGVLSQHSTTFGVLFVFATSRILDHECRVAIALQQKGGVSIVPIGRKQLGQVIAGQPFLRILHDQHVDSMVHSTKLAI